MIEFDNLMEMIDDMMKIDFAETPNLKAMVAVRDGLLEMNMYPEDFINDFVSRMDIDVSAADPVQATQLGERWADLISKFIESMYDSGFNNKNIVNMAHQVKLTLK